CDGRSGRPRSSRNSQPRASGCSNRTAAWPHQGKLKEALQFPRIRSRRIISNRKQEATMIFRQLFDSTSGTYTYLLASRHGGEALIIYPVIERIDRYLQLVHDLA